MNRPAHGFNYPHPAWVRSCWHWGALWRSPSWSRLSWWLAGDPGLGSWPPDGRGSWPSPMGGHSEADLTFVRLLIQRPELHRCAKVTSRLRSTQARPPCHQREALCVKSGGVGAAHDESRDTRGFSMPQRARPDPALGGWLTPHASTPVRLRSAPPRGCGGCRGLRRQGPTPDLGRRSRSTTGPPPATW